MAEFNGLTEDLEKLVTCVICNDVLTEPKTLPCLHTFCFTCIQSWNQTCQKERKPSICPSCRASISKVDVCKLPTSFQHNTMVQMYNTFKSKSNDKNLQSLNEAKLLIQNERDRLNEVLEKCTKELELSNESRKRFDNEIDLAQKELRRNTLLEIKILQDHEEAMMTRLNDIHTTNKAENDEEKSQYNETIQRIHNLTNQCYHLEVMNVEQFKPEDFQQLLNHCKTTVTGASILSKKPVKRNSSVRYTPYPKTNENNSGQDPQFGKIVHSVTDPSRCSIESLSHARCGFMNQFNIMTRDAEGDFCYTSKALIDVQIQDIVGNNVQTELTESQTGRYVVKYKAQKPSPYKVVVSIGGKSISNSPQNVETINANYADIKSLRVFETTRASGPLTLAMSNTGEMAVVNNENGNHFRVVLFNADGEYLRDFGSEGTEENRLIHPWGVYFNADRLLVSDHQDGYGCIKEFDNHGNYKKTVYKQTGMQFRRMCTTGQSIACLTFCEDSKETLIKLFSKQTGDLLQDIKLDIRDVGLPLYIAYDNNKYFVTFSEVHSIFVFQQNGALLNKFGEKGTEEGKFKAPVGVAVFGADMLLVCDINNHRVQLLNQDCQFIRSIGSRGNGLGQFRHPIDVVVTPDGQLFVLEYGGKRVQVFR